MGNQNSSVTRVWPTFLELMCGQQKPEESLRALLNLAYEQTGNGLAKEMKDLRGVPTRHLFERPLVSRSVYGLKVLLPLCFEHPIPAPERFLLWLIEHSGQECLPTRKLDPSQLNAGRRPDLFGHNEGLRADARKEAARNLLLHGSMGSEGKWWAFEGLTVVDCYLETPEMVLLVEGKRTEPVSTQTDWCGNRNQTARNLEAAQTVASGRRFAVLLVAENSTGIDRSDITKSLPHMEAHERNFLADHYLGCVTWSQVCAASGIESDLLIRVENVSLAATWLVSKGYASQQIGE